MAGKTRKYEGILKNPMPVEPTEHDSNVRIEALIDLWNISREQSKLKQYQAVLKVLMQKANVVIDKENKKYKDKRLPIAKLKNMDDVCNFVKFRREAIDSTLDILTVQYHVCKPLTVTEKKLFELSYVIPKLANILKIPAFMPSNIYTLLYKTVIDTKNFIQYRDILYLQKVQRLTKEKAIEKYLKDNNIYYRTTLEQKIDNVKRSMRRYKKDNFHIKIFYSKNLSKKLFDAYQKAGYISKDKIFTDEDVDRVAEMAIIMSAQKNSYKDYVKYGKKKLKGLRNTELFDVVQTYCYNVFSTFISM